jgi:hypothetical protein
VAKNRYGLTEELPLSWAAFMIALASSRINMHLCTLSILLAERQRD